MEISKDKVSNVRRECAVASLDVRPYFEQDVDISLELIEMVNRLGGDSDHDVVEAAEHAEFLLLQKHNKIKDPEQDEKDKIEFQN